MTTLVQTLYIIRSKPAKKCMPKILGYILLGAPPYTSYFWPKRNFEHLDFRKSVSLLSDIS